jgi:mRNA interferase RelE/StbE
LIHKYSARKSMKYNIQFKPRAVKDIEHLSSRLQTQLLKNIEEMSNDLTGDVKRLTNFTPEYRLRVGDYRVLFEINKKDIVIYRVRNRKEAYR